MDTHLHGNAQARLSTSSPWGKHLKSALLASEICSTLPLQRTTQMPLGVDSLVRWQTGHSQWYRAITSVETLTLPHPEIKTPLPRQALPIPASTETSELPVSAFAQHGIQDTVKTPD